MPKCNSKDTKELFFKIANSDLKQSGSREQLVSLENIDEMAFNKQSQIRICTAEGIFSDAIRAYYSYKIYWGKEKPNKIGEKIFYVEITDYDI